MRLVLGWLFPVIVFLAAVAVRGCWGNAYQCGPWPKEWGIDETFPSMLFTSFVPTSSIFTFLRMLHFFMIDYGLWSIDVFYELHNVEPRYQRTDDGAFGSNGVSVLGGFISVAGHTPPEYVGNEPDPHYNATNDEKKNDPNSDDSDLISIDDAKISKQRYNPKKAAPLTQTQVEKLRAKGEPFWKLKYIVLKHLANDVSIILKELVRGTDYDYHDEPNPYNYMIDQFQDRGWIKANDKVLKQHYIPRTIFTLFPCYLCSSFIGFGISPFNRTDSPVTTRKTTPTTLIRMVVKTIKMVKTAIITLTRVVIIFYHGMTTV